MRVPSSGRLRTWRPPVDVRDALVSVTRHLPVLATWQWRRVRRPHPADHALRTKWRVMADLPGRGAMNCGWTGPQRLDHRVSRLLPKQRRYADGQGRRDERWDADGSTVVSSSWLWSGRWPAERDGRSRSAASTGSARACCCAGAASTSRGVRPPSRPTPPQKPRPWGGGLPTWSAFAAN